METFDCIVLGVGGFGSGVLYHLARRGVSVLGLERFDVAHERGSSHGETRIVRKAYFEHPDYVPLLSRAYELWDELQSEYSRQTSGQRDRLMHMCGVLLAGPSDGNVVSGARLSAQRYQVPVQQLTVSEARQQFPGLRFPDDYAAVFEPDAGYLHVEECVRAHIRCACSHKATLKTGETVLDWRASKGTVHVRTDRGEYEAAGLVVTPGPWAAELLCQLNVGFNVVRKVQLWHPVVADADSIAAGSVFYFETPDGDFYGVPSQGDGTMKIGRHDGGTPVTDPSAVDRELHRGDVEEVARFLRSAIPGLDPKPVRHSVCMYTHSPDHHFVIDRYPGTENVVFGAGFSGHGFKFTTVLGEAMADLVLDGRTRQPVSVFRLDRFSRASE